MDEKLLQTGARPPVVAIVGHIDHGKSTLLDYIRKTNVVAEEAGGITQHLSAYEAVHKNATGEHVITFLDTPGHEAFKAMRSRGLEVADVAILVVSAEDGVKPQTVEALKLIEAVKIPYIVAFTKVDKPTANVEKAKMTLLENGVYLEGMGGNIPFVPVSGKTGAGVPELLDLILLAAELEGLSADLDAPAEGVVIEAHVDNKRGSTATLIVENGTLESGEFVVTGESFAPVRIMENFRGVAIKEAKPGMPVRIVGFSSLPTVGARFKTVESKKDAEEDVASVRRSRAVENARLASSTEDAKRSAASEAAKNEAVEMTPEEAEEQRIHMVLPIVIKTDVAGTGEAVLHEIDKFPKDDRLEIRVVSRGVGPISEADVKLVAGGAVPGIIIGFNVKVDNATRDLAERQGVKIELFDIIYKLTEWLAKEVETRRPRAQVEERIAHARVLKVFSSAKGKVILGGRVEEGALLQGAEVKILRRDVVLGVGKIVSLQSQKKEVKTVESGAEFGAQVKTDAEPAANDYLEAFTLVMK
jgi:translation initiation factor IF-2